MNEDAVTFVLPAAAAGAVCIVGQGVSGSELAASLRELADRIEPLSAEQLNAHPAASTIHRHNRHYFVEKDGCFVTPCDTGVGSKYTMVTIGATAEEARQVLERTDANLGGGLVACDQWEIAFDCILGPAQPAEPSQNEKHPLDFTAYSSHNVKA